MPRLLLALCLTLILTPAKAESELKIAASIAPVYAAVAPIAAGAADVRLILPPGFSPHHAALRPSQARAMAEADVVFWVGPAMEPGTARAVAALAEGRAVALAEVDGLIRHPVREAALWGGEDHDHGHDHEDEIDPHLWLDTRNHRVWLAAVAERLTALDPANAALYAENLAAALSETDALEGELSALLAGKDAPFVVDHDAYQYLERQFDLNAVAAITLSHAHPPGAAQLRAIRNRLREAQIACAFVSPQINDRLVRAATEGSGARLAKIDPIGAGEYPATMRRIAEAMAGCL